jgi:hypothetical protein
MSQEDKTPVRTGDPATDEILNSMEEDGMELPDNLKPKAPVLSKKENEGDRPDEGEEESKPDESEEEDEFKADFDESDKEEGEEESKDEEEEDDDSVGLSPSASRPSAQRPGEYYRLERQINRLTKTIEGLATDKTKPEEKKQEDIDTEIATFAQANRLNPDVAKGLIELAAKKLGGTGLSKETQEAIEQVVAQNNERRFWSDQDASYERDFNQNVLPIVLRENPDITQDAVDKLYDSLHSAAFSPEAGQRKNPTTGKYEGGAQKSLVELYFATSKPTKPKDNRTSEDANPSHISQDGTNYDDVTADDIAQMSDAEFDKFSDTMGKRAKSQIRSL